MVASHLPKFTVMKFTSILGPVHTYPDIFENASFLSVLGLRPHGDGVFGRQKRSFSKTLSRVDLFENAVFMLSCGRVKAELFFISSSFSISSFL